MPFRFAERTHPDQCKHTRSGVCLASVPVDCVCHRPAGAYHRLLDQLNLIRQQQLAIEQPAWIQHRADARHATAGRARLVLWTIYDHPRNISLFVARRSELPAPESQVEHCMFSSDVDAIRRQLAGLGLSCYGRDPEDDPDIIEVWL